MSYATFSDNGYGQRDVKQIYAKLHVRSRAEAVARVAGPWRAG